MRDTTAGTFAAQSDGDSYIDPLAAVASALCAQPIDEPMLFNHVWEYVVAERSRGTPPGRVIMTLTDLVVGTDVTTVLRNQALQRSVIVAAVEAYFGQIGGQVLGPAYPEYSGDSQAEALMVPSERRGQRA